MTSTPVVTNYVGELYEETSGQGLNSIFLGSQKIAAINTQTGDIRYYHGDHLGSVNVVTDSNGTLQELLEYDPYGKIQVHKGLSSNTQWAGNEFTGKKLDDETGLYYYGARYYDPSLGKFITPDSIIPYAGDPQSYNRYSYVRNNPVNLIDPTGHKWSWGKFWKAAVAAVVSAVVFVATGGTATPVIAGFWAGMAGGAVSGALSGGGWKAVLQGAAFGAVTGAALGGIGAWGVDKFGEGFGWAMLAAGGAYAAATGNLDSFAGGLVGSIAGIGINSAFSKANSSTSRVDKLADQLANDDNLAGDNIGANFGKSILELNQEGNILTKIAMINRVTAVVDKGIWWSTFGKTFVNGVANSTYIDGGASFAAPGSLRPAFKFGFRLSSKGLDGYYGFGLGSGWGGSLTVNTSTGASNAISTGISIKGGTGIYGYSFNGNAGFGGVGASGGVGWGIGNGVSVGATHRFHIWGGDN